GSGRPGTPPPPAPRHAGWVAGAAPRCGPRGPPPPVPGAADRETLPRCGAWPARVGHRRDRPADRTPSAGAKADECAEPARPGRGHALAGSRIPAGRDARAARPGNRPDAPASRASGRPPPSRGGGPALRRAAIEGSHVLAPGAPRGRDSLHPPDDGPTHRGRVAPAAGPGKPPRRAPRERGFGPRWQAVFPPFSLTVYAGLPTLL